MNLPLLWLSPLVWDPRRKKHINAVVYEGGVASLLTVIGKELAGRPFSARYPNDEPPGSEETSADSEETPADNAEEDPEAFNIQVTPRVLDFGIVKTGAPNVNLEVILSWDGKSPHLIRRFPSGGDWWDISETSSETGRVTFMVSAKADDDIPNGRHVSYFDIMIDDVAYRIELAMTINDSRHSTRTARELRMLTSTLPVLPSKIPALPTKVPALPSRAVFAYRGSWLLATVATLLISEYIEHFFNPTGSPPALLVPIAGLWNLTVIVYGLRRTFRRSRLIVIPSPKRLWIYTSVAVVIFVVSIALLWTFKNGVSGWTS